MNTDISTREHLLDEVVTAYLRAAADGRAPDRDRLLAEYPDLAADLVEFFADQDRLQHLAAPLRAVSRAAAGEEDLVSRTLGDFRILREVGRGGMGVVYEAEQLSLRRRVALKVLPYAGMLDPRQLLRFQNEAQAAACLHHTNIVPVHFVGCERGVHFYAMQLIDGQTLAALIRQLRQPDAAREPAPPASEGTTAYQPPPGDLATPTELVAAQVTLSTGGPGRGREYFRKVAGLGVQAAEALDHAHQAGIVHRDIKPANLMLDVRGNLWVTDFGLAQLQQGEANLTLTGELVGTLRYMSPEQALAKRVVIDHRSDIYSLGATLYELLTLRPAFDGKDRQQLLRQIAFEEPPRLRRLDRSIPAELETIVLKAMEKNPADRYTTALELADDLRRWLSDQPIQARRPSLPQRARKWLRRHPAVVRSVMLMVLLAAGASATGAWLLWQEKEQTRREKDRADQARDSAEKRLAQIEKGNDILGSVFRELNPNAEEQGEPELRVQLGERLEQAARLLEGEAVGDPLIVARLQDVLGRSLHALGQYDKAFPLLEKARQTREAELGPDHPDTLLSKNNLAVLFLDSGKYKLAEALFQEVLHAQMARLGADHPDTLNSKSNLASLYQFQGKFERAEALYKEALQARTARLGADHSDTLASKANLASLYQFQGKYERAEALYKEVLQARTAKLGPNHPHTLQSKNNLAALFSDQGKYDRAEALHMEVLQARTARLGPNHPHTLNSKNNLALVYYHQGKEERAEALFREVVQAWTAKRGADHPKSLLSKYNLARVYQVQNKYDQAEMLFQEVLQAQTASQEANHPDTLNSKHSLAVLYQARGKYDRAEALLREVLEARTARLGADHPDTLNNKNSLAVLYWRTHRLNQSVPLFEEVVRGRKAKLGADHPNTLQSIFNLAVNYRDAGRLDEAVALLDESLPRARTVLPPRNSVRTYGLRAGLATYSRAGRHDKLEPVLREMADLVKQQAGAESRPHAVYLAELGLNLLLQKKYPEAEKVLRDCLVIREKTEPDSWTAFKIRSMLGGALLGQKKYAAAEPLLLQGYDGMKQRQDKMPLATKGLLPEALERLVQLYDAWGKKDQASHWRKELEAARGSPKK
jgi:serine/threonine protein kinase/tetratricopeptide (TPR) repeat protein